MNKINRIEKFLNHFGTNKIVCHNTTDSKVSKMKVAPLIDCLNTNQLFDRDVYFYINNGGTKKNEMIPAACFTDLDAGKHENGNYLTESEVRVKKAKMFDKIGHFPLKPSFIVETRNGFQVYWLIKGTMNKIHYEAIQNKICSFFQNVGSDILTKKINQIYRVPGTIWHKKWTGLPPFTTKLVDFDSITVREQLENPNRYSYEEFEVAVKDIIINLKKSNAYSDFYHKSKKKSINKEELDSNIDLLLEIKEFLTEISSILFLQHKKFSAKQAKILAEKLSTTYNV